MVAETGEVVGDAGTVVEDGGAVVDGAVAVVEDGGAAAENGVASIDTVDAAEPSTSSGRSVNVAKKRKTAPSAMLTAVSLRARESILDLTKEEHNKKMEVMKEQIALLQKEQELLDIKRKNTMEVHEMKMKLFKAQLDNLGNQ